MFVERQWGVVKARRLVRVSGISPPIDLRAFNNDINTLERAVKERVFYVKEQGVFVQPPRPARGVFAARLLATRQLLAKVLPKSAPLTGLGFVETFRGPKRKIYEAAYSSLLGKSLTVEDSHVKVFVKYEKTDFTRKTDPVPRVISPRSPRYNISVGRFLRTIEERIFRSISQLFDGEITVFKGLNAIDSGRSMRQKWDAFREPVAVGLDASRFDQHVSRQALEWEHEVYISCFPTRKHKRALGQLLRCQLRNICKGYTADGKLRYETDGGRMSGDINTSLGNCLLMCSMIHAYARARGVRILLANNGDDCVIFMEKCDYARFSQGLDGWFRDMGFNMMVEPPCDTFEQIEFCQTRPVFVGPNHNDYIMVRHPKYAIAKDTVCIHGWQTEEVYRGWLHAVGTGGLAMTGGIPIFQNFYCKFLSVGKFKSGAKDLQSWGVRQLSRGMSRAKSDVSAATRASFYWAFGVTPCEQVVLERFYDGVSLGNKLVSELLYQVPMPL